MPEHHQGLVSCETLFENLDEDWVVFDCRHDLGDPSVGPREYQKGHIPGAFHAHVDRDLSGPPGDGHKGRHPLPIAGSLVRFLRTYGVDDDTQVVAYDDMNGAWAGRLWWLLRHYGHEDVAVLDGGLQRWRSLNLPLSKDHARARDGSFSGKPGHMPVVDAMRIDHDREGGPGAYQIVDARAPERFSGEQERIDPVAGHIPGAINIPFATNVDGDGLFLSPDELRADYEKALGVQEVGKVAVYCGSGVTAAHDILAMEVAGMGTAALYPGGWSEWVHSEQRPVEREELA